MTFNIRFVDNYSTFYAYLFHLCRFVRLVSNFRLRHIPVERIFRIDGWVKNRMISNGEQNARAKTHPLVRRAERDWRRVESRFQRRNYRHTTWRRARTRPRSRTCRRVLANLPSHTEHKKKKEKLYTPL